MTGERDHGNVGRFRTVDGDRGRIGTRGCSQCADIGRRRERHPGWEGLASIGRVVSARETGGKTTVETRCPIPSPPPDAGRFAHAVRPHRGIGNRLHWALDVTFRDDDSRAGKDRGPRSFAVMKHMAMNLPNSAKDRGSIRVMWKRAGWNDGFPLRILGV